LKADSISFNAQTRKVFGNTSHERVIIVAAVLRVLRTPAQSADTSSTAEDPIDRRRTRHRGRGRRAARAGALPGGGLVDAGLLAELGELTLRLTEHVPLKRAA
jgi:hypothetical protein